MPPFFGGVWVGFRGTSTSVPERQPQSAQEPSWTLTLRWPGERRGHMASAPPVVPCHQRTRTAPCTPLRCVHQVRPCPLGRWRLAPQSGQHGCEVARRPGRTRTSLAAHADCSRSSPRRASRPVSSPAPGYRGAPRSKSHTPSAGAYPYKTTVASGLMPDRSSSRCRLPCR